MIVPPHGMRLMGVPSAGTPVLDLNRTRGLIVTPMPRPGAGRRPFRYLPYRELEDVPNVIVDGAPNKSTVLTISHWPGTPCPPGLEADLSAEMAFAYLGRADLHPPADYVSNNHFDQDGLVSVAVLVDPEGSTDRQDLMIDLASAGDFAVFHDPRAALASMAIATYADTERSPLGPAPGDYDAWAATLYDELLGRVHELVDEPDRYRDLWAEEHASLVASRAAFERGEATIEEFPEVDLAVVSVSAGAPDRGGHRFGGGWVGGLHPMAVHGATSCFRILTVRGRSFDLTYRYESWVQYRSRRPIPRVDLSKLAEELTGLEKAGNWVFDGVGTITPRLHLEGAGESSVPEDRFVSMVRGELASGEPAWDPYASRPAVEARS